MSTVYHRNVITC